jgi:hypothetical protein
MTHVVEYAISVNVCQDLAWNLFTDVASWTKISDIYQQVEWQTEPWLAGSTLAVRVRRPYPFVSRYLIRECVKPHRIRYVAYGSDLGFAAERTTTFVAVNGGTEIQTRGLFISLPVVAIPGTAAEFANEFTVRFYDAFREYCDCYQQMAQTRAI